jgi:hypothetical protein
MPTTKSAIDPKALAALIQDANAGRQISPLRFTDQLMYDLCDLEARATVKRRTAELDPGNAQLQAFMRRALEVMESLLEMGFTPENALFWFRAFRVVELNDRTPLSALSEDCSNVVIQSIRNVFVLNFDELGAHYERMREDTQSVQQEIFRDMRMLSAREAADRMGLHAGDMTALDLARAIEKSMRAVYVMNGHEPCFPACQFDMCGPKRIIADLIKTLSPYRSSWEIVVWLWGSNGWLGGDSPEDLLDSKPILVMDAAFQDVIEEIEADDEQL